MKSIKALLALALAVPLMLLAAPLLADETYVVQAGDTLFGIARRYGVTVQDIAAANNIVNPNLIYVGARLTIPTGGSTDAGSPPPQAGSQTYVVRPGDTLFRIAVSHRTTVAVLAQLNGISNPNLIYTGQVLRLPAGGGSGAPAATPTSAPSPQPTAAAPAPAPTATSAPQPGANLLPNPSFENGYRHVNGIPELQVPNGWQLGLVEGASAPGTGLTYLRPESRVMPSWLLPAHEHALFIYDGDWTVKVFKGQAPISFSLYTDVALQPGTYRFTAYYYPDLISGYSNGSKIWAGQSDAGEVSFILDGSQQGWSNVQPGVKNTLVQTFTVTSARQVRVGLAFRTRYALANNGFFMDNWALQRTGN
jgi:LysM repeat protein